MKRKKILLFALLIVCSSASMAYSEDLQLSAFNSDSGISKEEIPVDSQDRDINLKGVLLNTATDVNDSSNSETNTIADNQNSAQTIENKDDILLIKNLQGGVEKTPETKPEPIIPEELSTKKESLMSSWWNGNYATGDWFGFRNKLMEHGITINGMNISSGFGKGHGGMANARVIHGYSLYLLNATFDTEKMGLWKGGTGYVSYQHKYGSGLSYAYMGDYQVIDGWDFRETNQIAEYWYQQKLFKDKLRIKAGKQDALYDFTYLNSAFDFMNTSFSLMPTIPLPAYPDQKFGIMAEFSPTPKLALRSGVYNKDGGAFNINEVEVKTDIKGMPGRAIGGCWATSANKTATTGFDMYGNFVSRTFKDNQGGYAAYEQMVYKENPKKAEDNQGLVAFGQVGFTPGNRNDVNRYVGTGLHYQGLIPKRDNDLTGIGLASANFSRRLDAIDGRHAQENALECFYRFIVNPWFYIQSDFQYVFNVGGSTPGAMAFGLRSVVKF